jgi:hypothetical protein
MGPPSEQSPGYVSAGIPAVNVAWLKPVRKSKATFCEQKVAKKLYYAGPGAFAPTTPMAQHSKKFLRRFFQKAASSLWAFCSIIN